MQAQAVRRMSSSRVCDTDGYCMAQQSPTDSVFLVLLRLYLLAVSTISGHYSENMAFHGVFAYYSPMGGERGSTARQRMSGKTCCLCSNSLPPDPNHHGERLCAKGTEARQPLRDVYMYYMLRDGWYCQFLEADLKTALPRTFTFAHT